MASGDDKDSWKDTNVGMIGSDADKAARKSAADSEAAWQGSGQKAGLMVWRIEQFNVKAVDESTWGEFYKGDSYIVLQTTEHPDSGKLLHNIFFYLGLETSVDEQGTAAYKTVELDDYFGGEPIQHREVMGQETNEFKALFPNLTQLDGGCPSGFKHVVPDGHHTKMYQVRKVKTEIKIIQVPLQTKVLNDGDCFVLDAKDAIFVLDGPNASPIEKVEANKHAEILESERGGKVQATHDLGSDFWDQLEGSKPAWAANTPKSAPPATQAAASSAPAPALAAAPAVSNSSGTFSLEDLQKPGSLEGVDPRAKETHLSDADFQKVFDMSKADFAKLAGWKRDQAKKKHGLF